jgi:hypothetical protein
MVFRLAMIAALLAASEACSPPPETRWLKPGPYTSAEFHRDVEVCTRDGVLDHGCMEARGWVSVTPEKTGTGKKTTGTPRDVPVIPTPPGRR